PRGLAADSSGRLYVADSGNARVVVYAANPPSPGPTGTVIPTPNSSSVDSVAIAANSGEIWVAAFSDSRIYPYPEFSQLIPNPGFTAELFSVVPIGIALDAFDNVIAVEATNRLTFYYARAVYQHAATYASGVNLGSTLTPNQYTILYR